MDKTLLLFMKLLQTMILANISHNEGINTEVKMAYDSYTHLIMNNFITYSQRQIHTQCQQACLLKLIE